MDSILLNINTHDLNITNTSDFNIQFDALQLDHHNDYHIALVSYNIPYSWYNISAAQNNNQFRYSRDAGVSFRTVTIPDGNYGIEDLNLEIDALIVADGGATGKIIFYADYNSLRVDLEITDGNYQVDFIDGNSNNPRIIMGFNSLIYTTIGVERAPNGANVTNNIDSVSINCSIVDSGSVLLNNRQSSSLFHVTDYASGPGSYLTGRPSHPVYLPVNVAGNIHNLSISIRDQSDRIIDLNGENVTLSLHIKKF
jgi:hypothetical protein